MADAVVSFAVDRLIDLLISRVNISPEVSGEILGGEIRAEAVVTFAVDRLGDLLISEANFLHEVSGEILEIQREFERMKCFLKEADKKQTVDQRVKKLVAYIREVAFKTEDVIETFALVVAASRNSKSSFTKTLRRFSCFGGKCACLDKNDIEIEPTRAEISNFTKSLQSIKDELSGLTASLQTYGIMRVVEEGESSNTVDLSRISYSHSIEEYFVGMEKEIKQLVSHWNNEDKHCEVISICGMGGQGKTTVASRLYNHPQVKAHFNAFAWVCITQQFDREKILKSILQQLLPARRKAEISTMDDWIMVNELYKVQQYEHDHYREARVKRIRRLCIRSYVHMHEPKVDKNVIPQVRSLLLFNERDDQAEETFSLPEFKLLRLLKVEGFTLSAKSLTGIGNLVYLKHLSYKGCVLVEELPSTIGNLRNLQTLDLRVKNEIRIPNVVHKFKQLKYLYLPNPYLRRSMDKQEKVRLDGLNELELIQGFDSRYNDIHDLIELSKIKVFEGRIVVDEKHPMIIENTIEVINSKELSYSSLSIDCERQEVSLVLLLENSFIDCLLINARISTLPENYDHSRLSKRLSSLHLWNCEIKEFDPMIILEKLPNLTHLCLGRNSYLGREMICSRFPQLQALEVWSLPNLENWRPA